MSWIFFYTFGILDERAHDNIGDTFCIFLFLLTGVFDSVRACLLERALSHQEKHAAHRSLLFTTTRPTLHPGISPPPLPIIAC